MLKRAIVSFSLFSALFLTSCGEHSFDDLLNCSDIECVLEESLGILERTGWLADDEKLDSIPQDIADLDTLGSDLPPLKSLEVRFPPIGDQGQYGTCVAWATGYNLKTALNAIDKGWGSADLAKTANQTSPKDLWFIIENSKKGSSCNGTNFEPAMDALITKGASSLSSVPYTNMGNCSGTSAGNSGNKLANYRKIAYNNALSGGSGSGGMNVDNFKGYLAQGRPILIGAKLGDRFMRWNNATVISSDTYNDPGMQHAYHAMVLVGYDNSKNAFRVRNSWGPSWGDNGSIWVNYDFFLRSFAFAAFVAQNPAPAVSSQVSQEQLLTGYDLLAANAEDYEDTDATSQLERIFTYEIYNSGKETILASSRWTVLYMYYNAFNANDFDIIFEDYYTDEFGEGDGEYFGSKARDGGWWNNADVLPGKRAGEAEFGEEGFKISYKMPKITGKYYLVVYADAHNKIEESNEDNNFYFLGAEGGKPLEFANGIMLNKPVSAKILAKKAGGKVEATAKSVQEIGGSPNAYTPEEIKKLVLKSKKNGVLAKKIAEHSADAGKVVKKRRVAN